MTSTLEPDLRTRPAPAHPDRRVPTLRPIPRGRRVALSSSVLTAGALGALVVLAAVLRFWHLGATHLNYDESFTAIAGRRPVGGMLAFLTAHDSHPPLDYLLRAPLARLGVSELWLRVPSAACSVGAVALLAWWLRDRPRLAIVATALMAVTAFQVTHGRTARMYAELELLGVAIAFLTDLWLRRPRTRHAIMLGLLVLVGLLTHVSMFLLAAGLLVVPGRRTDRAAWQFRGAIGAAGLAWLALWGRHFAVQAQGGHSSWIPATTVHGLIDALGAAITTDSALTGLAVVASLAGGALLVRRHDRLGRILVCLFVVPVAIGAVAGLGLPVVIDRTFTLMAWAPLVGIAALVEALSRRAAVLGALVAVPLVAFTLAGTVPALSAHAGPDTALRAIEAHARPGDVVAVRPAYKAPEMQWTFGVRAFPGSSTVHLASAHLSYAMRLGHAPATGRIWLLDWHRWARPHGWGSASCHRTVRWGRTSIRCIAAGTTRTAMVAAALTAAPAQR